jgi:hypothetical protein
LKAVLKYAAELRHAAEQARAGDPNMDLYAPSEAAARKVCQEACNRYGKDDGPAEALRTLASRARLRELEVEESHLRASQARSVHLRHRLVASGERDAELSRMSLGARLDQALLGLRVLSEVSAVRLDGDRVKGGERNGLPRLIRKLERDTFVAEAEMLLRRVEQALDQAKRRMAEVERAA